MIVRSAIRNALLAYEPAYRLARRARAVARYAARRPHEADFAAFRHFRDDNRLFLDIGANAGQSALSFRLAHRRAPILSIEANDENEPELRFVGRLIRDFEFLICAAGEERGTATLHVPTLHGVRLTGDASLLGPLGERYYRARAEEGGRGSAEYEFVPKRVDVRPLDELELEPGFVKVDVEGSELPALRGLARTLERHRPVLMVERTPLFADVAAFLASLDYQPAVYDPERDRFEPYAGQEPQNVFFLPPHRRLAAA